MPDQQPNPDDIQRMLRAIAGLAPAIGGMANMTGNAMDSAAGQPQPATPASSPTRFMSS